MPTPIRKIIQDQFRLLTFRSFRPDLANHANAYLAFGLATAWLAGVGRYWDNPKADLWQYLGLGSVLYCFFLAAVIHVLLLPLRPRNWRYRNLLIFVSLTSLPAILYAIPVERFMSLENAQRANVWFLAVVALWRVVLLVLYLRRAAGLTGVQILVGTLLPLTLIVSALTALNLEHAVFEIMAGLHSPAPTGNDAAYFVLIVLTMGSLWLAPFLLVVYGVQVVKVRRAG